MDFTRLKHIAEASIVDQQISAQETIFKSRREIVEKQVEQLDQRVVQIASLIGGLQDQKHLLTEEIELVQSLLQDQEKLFEKKLIQNSQIVELKRNLNQLQSKSASLTAESPKMNRQRTKSFWKS